MPVRESDLYQPLKRFFTARGYDVKGEVCGCDIVATRPGEPAILMIAELKLGLSLELILQAVDRMGAADEIWLIVQATRRGRDRDRRARTLCRLLGFGLVAVSLGRGMVEILVQPGPYRPRRNLRRRRSLLHEHEARHGDPSLGGTRGVPVMTAYRQDALACAERLRHGPLPTREFRAITPRATAILSRNVYGWFERTARGVYGLTPAGRAALPCSDLPGSL